MPSARFDAIEQHPPFLLLLKPFVSNCCSTDLFDSKSSKRDQIKSGDDFAVPGPDRPQPVYYTNWRQSPSIPPRRGRHYNVSKVGPPITISLYTPTIFFGRLLRVLWGEIPLWELSQSSIDIDSYLPIRLRAIPLPTISDHIKHQILCAKPIIWMVRRSQVQSHPVSQSSTKKQSINELLTDQQYNFVLLGDGRLVFARIPHRTPKWPYRLLSKHVALANCSSNVRFAGELQKSDNGETLLINNKSGTYRPDDKMVPQAVKYFQRLFPHLSIRDISRN